jgi:hypothetical protein
MTASTDLRDIMAKCDRSLLAALLMVLLPASANGLWSAAKGVPVILEPVTREIVRVYHEPEARVQISIKSDASDVGRASLLAEHKCLSEVMYYEARGEGVQGEKAVAEVVFHRLESGRYGNSICGVVYAGSTHPGCQFSFTCDGSLDRPKDAEAWRAAQVLAVRIMTGEQPLPDATDGATNYHAVYVRPVWAGDLVRTAQIGNHIFYRTSDGDSLVLKARAFRGEIW